MKPKISTLLLDPQIQWIWWPSQNKDPSNSTVVISVICFFLVSIYWIITVAPGFKVSRLWACTAATLVRLLLLEHLKSLLCQSLRTCSRGHPVWVSGVSPSLPPSLPPSLQTWSPAGGCIFEKLCQCHRMRREVPVDARIEPGLLPFVSTWQRLFQINR